jgi:molybdopterin adenylyltransferase
MCDCTSGNLGVELMRFRISPLRGLSGMTEEVQAMSSIDESRQFVPLNIAVLTISDTRSLADDKSGTTLSERLIAAGHTLAAREIIVDDVDAIRIIIKRWIADADIDVVITTGGTGFTGRDVTPEAIEPLFEKRMDGFSIAFHMLSYAKIGTSTIQSRATAGVAGATFIFCLPGSPGACRDGWDGILAAQLDYRTRPCNFVEIMSRLDEHLRRPKAKGASA